MRLTAWALSDAFLKETHVDTIGVLVPPTPGHDGLTGRRKATTKIIAPPLSIFMITPTKTNKQTASLRAAKLYPHRIVGVPVRSLGGEIPRQTLRPHPAAGGAPLQGVAQAPTSALGRRAWLVAIIVVIILGGKEGHEGGDGGREEERCRH